MFNNIRIELQNYYSTTKLVGVFYYYVSFLDLCCRYIFEDIRFKKLNNRENRVCFCCIISSEFSNDFSDGTHLNSV